MRFGLEQPEAELAKMESGQGGRGREMYDTRYS